MVINVKRFEKQCFSCYIDILKSKCSFLCEICTCLHLHSCQESIFIVLTIKWNES